MEDCVRIRRTNPAWKTADFGVDKFGKDLLALYFTTVNRSDGFNRVSPVILNESG
jgi:hypothetical protein